jgi:hypothetical protein
VKKKLIGTVMAMAVFAPTLAMAEQCEPSRWTVTLEMLEPLTADERQAVLAVLGIDMDPDILDQAIAENAMPLEVFGGQ